MSLNRDAFVMDHVAMTVELQRRRAPSDVDDLALGDGPEVETA